MRVKIGQAARLQIRFLLHAKIRHHGRIDQLCQTFQLAALEHVDLPGVRQGVITRAGAVGIGGFVPDRKEIGHFIVAALVQEILAGIFPEQALKGHGLRVRLAGVAVIARPRQMPDPDRVKGIFLKLRLRALR